MGCGPCNREGRKERAMLYLSPAITVYCCVLAGVFGACMGSFLNCMAWRIVHGESVLRGRSHCDECGHVLTAGDLVPVFSYAFHRGRCRWCGAKLSVRHMLAELVTAVVFVALLLRYDISLQTLEYAIFACILLASAFADLEGYMIPDRFILTGFIVRIAFVFLLPDWEHDLPDAALGGFAVGGGLLAVVLLYEKLRGIEAMGGGDVKLVFLTGLYLGWKRNLLCLLLACVIGIVFGLIAQLRRAKPEAQDAPRAENEPEDPKLFPWGPSICAAAIITLLWGGELIEAYLGLFT